MQEPEGTLDLIKRAQDGDDLAFTALYHIIDTHHRGKYVGRYYGMNVLVSNEEIDSEFMLGVWKALSSVKLDVGNPVNFLCWKGMKAVQTLMRNNIRRETRYRCTDCGNVGVMGYRAKSPVCTQCGTTDIFAWMVEIPYPTDDAGNSLMDSWVLAEGVSAETAWQLAVYGIQIEEIRDRLNGRVLELFDILVLEGIRDSSKNYLREIAERWGVSQMRVVHALRKLYGAIEAYFDEAKEC